MINRYRSQHQSKLRIYTIIIFMFNFILFSFLFYLFCVNKKVNFITFVFIVIILLYIFMGQGRLLIQFYLNFYIVCMYRCQPILEHTLYYNSNTLIVGFYSTVRVQAHFLLFLIRVIILQTIQKSYYIILFSQLYKYF